MGHSSAYQDGSGWLGGRTVAAVVGLLAIVHLVAATRTGLFHDEGYYTLWSQHLSTGYLDHPPMVALLIAAGRAVLGNNEFGVRVLSVICILLTSMAIWRIGTILIGRQAAGLAVVGYNLTALHSLGFVATPDQPAILFWTGALWAVAEFGRSRNANWWLVVGLSVGLGLLSKYSIAFLVPGLLLYLLTAPERRAWLKRWQVWAGVLVALAVFSPNLWWNAQHDWATFLFQGGRTYRSAIDLATTPVRLIEFALGLIGTLGVTFMPLAGGALVLFFVRRSRAGWSQLALPIWTSVPALAYFAAHTLHSRVEANWPMPLVPALALIAGWALAALWQRRPWVGGTLLGVQIATGLVAIVVITAQLIAQVLDLGRDDRTNETRGWRELVAASQDAADANGARLIVTTGDYALTGELAAYALFAGSPLPVRPLTTGDVRWAFLPPLDAETASGPVLLVATSEQEAANLGATELVATVERRDTRQAFATYWLYVMDRVPAPR